MKGRLRARWFGVGSCLFGALACGGTTSKHGGSPPMAGQGSGGVEAGGPSKMSEAEDGGGSGRGGSRPVASGAGGSVSGTGGAIGAAGTPVVDPCGQAAPSGAVVFASPLGGRSDFGNPGWQSSFFVSGCKEFAEADLSCSLAATCPPEGVTTVERFPIGGCPGRGYKVRFRFSAIVEPKQYLGGKRDANQAPANQLGGIWDTFYRDGEPAPSEQNVWKLTVHDENGVELRHYYLNAFPPEVPYAEHAYSVQFEKTIVVVGGGIVSHSVHSPKCRVQNNCGAHPPEDGCGGARSMSAPDNTAKLPAMYRDAEDGMLKATPLLSPAIPDATTDQAWHSQVGMLTALSIEPTDDPVTIDYP